jgi:TP901 family phage tail tape measure protein
VVRLARGGIRIPIITEFDGKAIDAFAKKTEKLGKNLTRNVTLPIVAMGTVAVKAFSDFESAMTQSLAIMGDVSDELRVRMEESARSVAKELGLSHKEAAESFFFLASAGLDAEQSIAALPQVAKFAKAGMFDMATATDLATDAQSALGLTVKDANQNLINLTRVTDVFVKANTLANATVEQFATAITSKAGVALRNVNKDIEEGVAVLSLFADQGVKGEAAGVLLTRTLEGLSDNARKNSKAFEEFNITVFDSEGEMRNLADITRDMEKAFEGMSTEQKSASISQLGFSKLAKQGVLQMLGFSDAIEGYEKQLREAGGITDEVANKQMAAFSEQVKILKSEFIDLAIDIGPIIIDSFLKPLMEILRGIAERFASLSDEQRHQIVMFAAIAAAIGPLLIIIAKLITAIKTIGAALMFLSANPIGLTILAIAGLIAIGIALWKNWDTIKENIITIFENLKEGVVTRFETLRDKFIEIMGSLPGPVKVAANLIISYWNAVLRGVEGVVNAIANAINRIPAFTVPNFVPGIGGRTFSPPRMSGISLPQIPLLADGGIVTSATLAMIGEAGPEAVIPLSGPNSKALGTTYNITINAGIGTDGMQVGRQIVDAIKRFEKQSGPVFASV